MVAMVGLIFYLINFLDACVLILNLMPATHFKQVGIGTTKDWESSEMVPKENSGLVTGERKDGARVNAFGNAPLSKGNW